MGMSEFCMGAWGRADVSFQKAERIFSEIGHVRCLPNLLIARSRLEVRRENDDTAAELADRALVEYRRSSNRRGIVLALEQQGDLALAQGDLRAAEAAYETALADARDLAPRGDLVYELAWRLSRVRARQGRLEEAHGLAVEAEELAKASGDRREVAHSLAARGNVEILRSHVEQGRELLGESLALFVEISTPYEQAVVHEEIAATFTSPGPEDSLQVLRHLHDASLIYSRLGAKKALKRVDDRRVRLERSLLAESGSGAGPGAQFGEPTQFVFADPEMHRINELVLDLSAHDSSVLLEGETGTGKELLARLIHDAGPRCDDPYLALNCAAFPSQLLESQLFGHRKGAFTGADADHPGLLISAGNGTVFLDEMDKASRDFQSRLLRVLEDRTVLAVGSNVSQKFSARIVCATNRDLKSLAREGRFLVDLYYRLAAFRVTVPPLRERTLDIDALVDYFLAQCAGKFGVGSPRISDEARIAMRNYEWPGNVRELKNVVESAAFFARDEESIRSSHLPAEIRTSLAGDKPAVTLPERIADVERRAIRSAIQRANGVKAEAARYLGVSRKGLRDRLERLGMDEFLRRNESDLQEEEADG